MKVRVDVEPVAKGWRDSWTEAGQWYSESVHQERAPEVMTGMVATVAAHWPRDGVAIIIRRAA